MPGILPRLNNLLTSGFDYIAFLMAQIYSMVRLLPPNHPYLNPQNIGKFSIRSVIAQAANQLEFNKKNIDQIVIFSAILIGLIILVVQVAMILIALIFEPAIAAFPGAPHPTGMSTVGSIFVTPNSVAPASGFASFDIAYILLDQVFGVPNIFNSCIAQGITCATTGSTVAPAGIAFPWPFHVALHSLFNFYNTGILVVGALIFLYFLVIVVGETAVTGTPFGQRFQNVWVPIRLVMAIGLLIPLPIVYPGSPGAAYNSGQYITLYAARFGSSFATNGWITYNNVIRAQMGGPGANPLGEQQSLIGNPKTPDITPILEAMSIVHACAMAYWFIDASNPKQPLPPFMRGVQPYFYKNAPNWMPNTDQVQNVNMGTTYANALQFYNNGDITIRFGKNGDITALGGNSNNNIDTAAGETEDPVCGEIKISIHQVGSPVPDVGPERVQRYYFELIRNLWFQRTTYELDSFGYRYAGIKLGAAGSGRNIFYTCPPGTLPGSALPPSPPPHNIAGRIPGATADECVQPPDAEWRRTHLTAFQAQTRTDLTGFWNTYTAQTNLYEMNGDILQRGWAGAGIWFNTIARVNGNYMAAVRDIPIFSKYPTSMEKIAKEKRDEQEIIETKHQFCTDEKELSLMDDFEKVGSVLCDVYRYWNGDRKNLGEDEVVITGSAFEDAMNLIFGTHPLSAMTAENVTTHPLAQLTLLGKGLVDASIRNIATASATSAVGGLGAIFDKIIPGLVAPSADFILSTAFVGLTGGLVLYYIVPFLPFIYFFFAVASWVKSIFEAMVGVPLWALAHLRLDGEGLPGTSAANGYYLIFEIFLRPILTIFGLIAAILIFTAQVRVLHFLWQIVTENLSGYDNDPTISLAGEGRLAFKRSVIDQFFFNIIYAIIVYMMAIAAFKLIDKIPDNLLRWMGNSVSSFGDINQDSVDGLTRYAALGGATAGRELASGIQKASQGAGGSVGTLLNRLSGGS